MVLYVLKCVRQAVGIAVIYHEENYSGRIPDILIWVLKPFYEQRASHPRLFVVSVVESELRA